MVPAPEPQAGAVKRFTRHRAILIGADQYQHVQSLQYCGKDVRNLAAALRESLEFEPADVLEFTAAGPHKPERGPILQHVIEFLKRDIGPDELLLFYFAGHGMIDADSKEDYLLPADAIPDALSDTGLSVNGLTKRLAKTGCKNIVMFIDACRENLDGGRGLVSVGEASRKALEREGIVTFFSCDPRERSFEIGELEQGSFTHCLMNAIREDDCSTVEAIDQYLRDNVPLINAKYNKPAQRPFTIIHPAEKAQLAIFYNQMAQEGAGDKYVRLQDQLGDILVESDALDAKSFSEAIVFLDELRRPCALSGDDKRRLQYIELACARDMPPRAFRVAWDALRRSRLKGPTKTLESAL